MFDGLLDRLGRVRRAPIGLALPTGKYEIVGSNCRIRVDARRYARRSRLWGLLVAGGRTRARVELEWQKNTEYAGSLDLSQAVDVSPGDLLRETAFVSVEDQYGRSARLSIDGASQLSLARQFLDRDREVLQTIDFTAEGNARRFARSGFSGPEGGHTWTEGHAAELVFPSSVRPGERYELGMQLWPFLSPALESQGVTVRLNGSERAFYLDRNSPAFLSLTFPGDDLGAVDEMNLHLQISNPGRPSDAGTSKDGRLLGVAFKQMVFSRLLGV